MFLFICSDFFVGVYQAIKQLNECLTLEPHRQQSGRSDWAIEFSFNFNFIDKNCILRLILLPIGKFLRIGILESCATKMVSHKKNWPHVRLRHLRKLLPITTAVCNNRNFAALMGTRPVWYAFYGAIAAWLMCSIHSSFICFFFITQISTTKQWHTFKVKKSHSLTVWQY